MMFRKIESAARRLYRKQKRPFPKGKKNGIWQNCRLKNWPLSVWAMDRAHPLQLSVTAVIHLQFLMMKENL